MVFAHCGILYDFQILCVWQNILYVWQNHIDLTDIWTDLEKFPQTTWFLWIFIVIFIGKFSGSKNVVLRHNIKRYLLTFPRIWKCRKNSSPNITRGDFLATNEVCESLDNNYNKISWKSGVPKLKWSVETMSSLVEHRKRCSYHGDWWEEFSYIIFVRNCWRLAWNCRTPRSYIHKKITSFGKLFYSVHFTKCCWEWVHPIGSNWIFAW